MIDSPFFFYFNGFALKYFWLDVLAIFLAKFLPYVLVFFLLVFLIKDFKKYWKMPVEALLAGVLGNLVLVSMLRILFQRPRPFIKNSVNLLLTHSQTFSFPSGHATLFFGLSTIVYCYNKKIGIFFFLASFLIALARVFTGLHWPLDILGGAMLGVLCGFLVHYLSPHLFRMSHLNGWGRRSQYPLDEI